MESYRILLTSKEDSLFHFRHYTNKEMFDGIRQRHGFQVDFDRYPRVLLDVFDEASNPSKTDIEVTFAARRDGTAQFTISKLLYNGAKTINVLNLNFTQSSDKQREKDRMRLGHSIKRTRSPDSQVKFRESGTIKSKTVKNKDRGKTPRQSKNERTRKRSAGKTTGGQLFRLMASLCYLKRLRQSNMHTVQIPDVIKTYNISHEPNWTSVVLEEKYLISLIKKE